MGNASRAGARGSSQRGRDTGTVIDVKRMDLGADIVALPERNLIVLHPDLGYSESLGAIMGTLPNIHPDVAQRLVEKVTPRPGNEPHLARVTGLVHAARLVLVGIVVAVVLGIFAQPTPALASARFGPDWYAASRALGLDCRGSGHDVRNCVARDGDKVTMSGYSHSTGTLYVAQGGGDDAIIFVFNQKHDADRYVKLHPTAEQHGRAVIWR